MAEKRNTIFFISFVMLTISYWLSASVLVGDKPFIDTTDTAGWNDYKADLLAARDLLANAYQFDAILMGDDNGEAGW